MECVGEEKEKGKERSPHRPVAVLQRRELCPFFRCGCDEVVETEQSLASDPRG